MQQGQKRENIKTSGSEQGGLPERRPRPYREEGGRSDRATGLELVLKSSRLPALTSPARDYKPLVLVTCDSQRTDSNVERACGYARTYDGVQRKC